MNRLKEAMLLLISNDETFLMTAVNMAWSSLCAQVRMPNCSARTSLHLHPVVISDELQKR